MLPAPKPQTTPKDHTLFRLDHDVYTTPAQYFEIPHQQMPIAISTCYISACTSTTSNPRHYYVAPPFHGNHGAKIGWGNIADPRYSEQKSTPRVTLKKRLPWRRSYESPRLRRRTVVSVRDCGSIFLGLTRPRDTLWLHLHNMLDQYSTQDETPRFSDAHLSGWLWQ